MAEKYKGRVEFLLVYIREAHPTDGMQAPRNAQDGIQISAAKDFGQKEEYASSCARNLGIKFTTVVDNMDAKVELEYMGWPDRLYLIGRDGRIAWKGDADGGDALEKRLEGQVKKAAADAAGGDTFEKRLDGACEKSACECGRRRQPRKRAGPCM